MYISNADASITTKLPENNFTNKISLFKYILVSLINHNRICIIVLMLNLFCRHYLHKFYVKYRHFYPYRAKIITKVSPMLMIINKAIKVHNFIFLLYVRVVRPKHDGTETLHLTTIVYINEYYRFAWNVLTHLKRLFTVARRECIL